MINKCWKRKICYTEDKSTLYCNFEQSVMNICYMKKEEAAAEKRVDRGSDRTLVHNFSSAGDMR